MVMFFKYFFCLYFWQTRAWCCMGRNHHSLARQCALCFSLCHHSKCYTVCWVGVSFASSGEHALELLYLFFKYIYNLSWLGDIWPYYNFVLFYSHNPNVHNLFIIFYLDIEVCSFFLLFSLSCLHNNFIVFFICSHVM